MGTFASVLAELVTGVQNTHPNTSTLLAAALVRQLNNLQPEAIPFMEASGSFNTTAGTAAYTSSTSGFPKSLLRFDRLYYDLGNYARPLMLVDPETIRLLQEQGNIAYPIRVCWLNEALQFGPPPAATYTVKWDGVLDATKDTTSGAVLTTASTTQTNAWFTEGAVVLKHLVWADYFLTSPDTRPDLASSHSQLAATALNRLRETYKKRQGMAGIPVTPNAFDEGVEGSGLRVSRLFPGAPV